MSAALLALIAPHRKRLLLFVLLIALSLQLAFGAFPPHLAVRVVQYLGYPLMLVTFAWFCLQLAASFPRAEWSARWRAGGWKVVLFVAAVSVLLHLQEPHGFKVMNDEVVQLSTSLRMHETREATAVARGYSLGGHFVLMQGEMDKRPLFFPFLLSLLHDLTGYRPANAFVLNALLTPLLLGLVYLVGKRVAGTGAGVAGVVLICTSPLLVQTAAGGGFEILNLVMIVGTIYLGLRYTRSPTSSGLGAFCLAGVLLAQVRYESVLFLLPLAAVVIYVTWRSRTLLLPWPLLFAPLLLVIYPLQMDIFELRPKLWQLGDRPSDHGVYSLAYFYDNVGRALRHFFSFDRTEANSHLVALCGIVGVAFFFMHLYRQNRVIAREQPEQAAFAIFIAAMFGQAVLMMCYFWGAYDDVVTVRLSLPTQLLAVLAFVYVWPHLLPRAPRWGVVVGAIGLYFFCWTLPTLAQRAYVHQNFAAETANWHRRHADEWADRNAFVVDPSMPYFWVAHQVPCVSYDVLAHRAQEFVFHFRRRTFGEYLFVQRLIVADASTGAMAPAVPYELNGSAKFETVREMLFSPTYAMRVSRLTELDEAKFLAWAEAVKQAEGAEPIPSDPQQKARDATITNEWLTNLP